jgi:TRAP-type mannitol/chloroaromatic compound transport system permease small subunit
MPRPIVAYVRIVDRLNRAVGRFTMYLVFVMMALLLWASLSRGVIFNRSDPWLFETSQFLMAAYYLLGGAYSLQLGAHVRMDLLYARWSPRRRALVDVLTVGFLIFYLAVLLLGGISSTEYAIETGQRNFSSWAPLMWPIKVIMCLGIVMMLLQAIASLFRDLATARGRPLA